MSSLAELPEVIGFFSYSREDDEDSHGALTTLRGRIQGELRGQLGRTARTFRLWQDKEAIASGTLWEGEIKNAVAQSVFFILIITPTVVASPYCKFELDSFLAREAVLGRDDLVFPILYIDVPALGDSTRRRNDPVLSLIAKRQYANWREFRHLDANSTEVKRQIERFCTHIRDALYRSWISPEERKMQEEAAARRLADAQRQQQEVEAKRREEEAAKERALPERKREEAERQRTDEWRTRTEAKASAKEDSDTKDRTPVKEADARQRAEGLARSKLEAEEARFKLIAGQESPRSQQYTLRALMWWVSIILIAVSAMQIALLILEPAHELYRNIGLDSCTDWSMSLTAGGSCAPHDMSWRTALVAALIMISLAAGIVSVRWSNQLLLTIFCAAGLPASLYCFIFTFWFWNYNPGRREMYSGQFVSSLFVALLFFDVVAFSGLTALAILRRLYSKT